MRSYCPFRSPSSVFVAAFVLALFASSAIPIAEALGLRTDRLSIAQHERWQSIVRLVFAEDALGRPLYPTLRSMWEETAGSDHEVYVELPEPNHSACCVAGLFRVESVSPAGHIVAVIRLHLDTIESAIVAGSAPRGFRRFRGLGLEERYAEVLGHELGHALWTLADPARAHAALALPSRTMECARALSRAKPDARAEIRRRLGELAAQAEAQEVPARAAEARVWQELRAGRVGGGELERLSPTGR
jgi:hypothetical protein